MTNTDNATATRKNGGKKTPPAPTVAPQMFRDAEGKTVTRLADIVAGAKAQFLAFTGKETTLTSAQIITAVKSVPGGGDTADLARIEAMQAAEIVASTPQPVTPHTTAYPEAVTLGKRLGEDFAAGVRAIVRGKEDYDAGVLVIADKIEREFGEVRGPDGKVTREDIVIAWPRPGTYPPGADIKRKGVIILAAGSNERADHYWSEATEEWFSFYGDLLDSSAIGQWWRKADQELEALANGATSGVSEEFLALGDDARKIGTARQRYATQRRNALAKTERAVAYLMRIRSMREHCPHVRVMPVNPDDAVDNARLNKPIFLWQPLENVPAGQPNPGVSSPALPISAFMNMDLVKAGIAGGRVKDLLATNKRAPKKPAPPASPTAVTSIKPVTPTHMETLFLAGQTFFDAGSTSAERDESKKRWADLSAHFQSPERDPELVTVGQFLRNADAWFSPFRRRFDLLEQAQAQKEADEAASRLQEKQQQGKA